MRTFKRTFAILSATLILSAPIWAASRTAILGVPGMTCSTCPITVKKALNKVSGVSKVAVSFEKKQAVVTYDDAKTNVEALVKATTDAGYPSKPDTTSKQ
jgi:mercuric ion binding protein